MSFKITEENVANNSNINLQNESIKIEVQQNKKDESILERTTSLYKFSIFMILFSSLIVLGSIAEAVIFANTILETTAVFGYIYILILSAVIYFVAIFSYREIFKYLDISRVEKIQERARNLERNPTKDSISFANMIIEKYENSENIAIAKGVENFKDEFPNLEYAQILPKLSEHILSETDLEVEKLIFKYAKENALATAISPVPLFDALFIIWRNIRMVNQILNIYGFRAGVIGNITLLRRVAEQLIFIGVAELTADSLSILTGQTIASKLSSSIAQGVGHSILTVRVGLATIQVSRPIQSKNDTSMILKFLKSFNPFKKK